MTTRKPSRATLRRYSERMSEAEYQRYLTRHEPRVAEQLEAELRRVFGGLSTHTQLALRAGLSTSTVRAYRNGARGPRGPLFRTILKLQNAGN